MKIFPWLVVTTRLCHHNHQSPWCFPTKHFWVHHWYTISSSPWEARRCCAAGTRWPSFGAVAWCESRRAIDVSVAGALSSLVDDASDGWVRLVMVEICWDGNGHCIDLDGLMLPEPTSTVHGSYPPRNFRSLGLGQLHTKLPLRTSWVHRCTDLEVLVAANASCSYYRLGKIA